MNKPIKTESSFQAIWREVCEEDAGHEYAAAHPACTCVYGLPGIKRDCPDHGHLVRSTEERDKPTSSTPEQADQRPFEPGERVSYCDAEATVISNHGRSGVVEVDGEGKMTWSWHAYGESVKRI